MTHYEPGAVVTWLQELRGGYGTIWPVDGVVVRTTRGRVIVRVQTRTGEQVERAVRPESLRMRREQEGEGQ
jgi:hypothetical protein